MGTKIRGGALLFLALTAAGCTSNPNIGQGQGSPQGAIPTTVSGPGAAPVVPAVVERTVVVEKIVTTTPLPTPTATHTIVAEATIRALMATTPTKVSANGGKTPTVKSNGNGKKPVALSTQQMDGWSLEYFDGATEQMKGWKFAGLVKDWDKFPNVDFPKYQFRAGDGVEYGMAESAYCQRAKTCDINVPAMHYRLTTGDYTIPGVDDCPKGVSGVGCGIMKINVGGVTAMFRDSSVDYGFTVEGRYWNGDAMPTTIRALLSHTGFNMLNIGGHALGINFPINAGANCSSAFGCRAVRLAFAVTSGNQLLVRGWQVVSR